uniref:DNA-3-methyladenine glycosylase I n=1 Tax=Oryza brachyantha TaxID=4533 RepID=J3L4X1_ORYBR
MCNSNVKSAGGVAQIDGRPVLQPAGNRVAAPEGARPLKKSLQKSLSMPASLDNAAAPPTCTATPENTRASDFARAAAAALLPPPTPASVNAKATRVAGAKVASARAAATAAAMGSLDRSRKPAKKAGGAVLPVVAFAGLEAYEPAGSIAAAQREHAALAQAQRKMRIAHYGRTASFSRVEGKVSATATGTAELVTGHDEKRCSFITPYSDPLYVAYHDEEWGVPVHDDGLLFEMLTLSGVQVGADWTSILKRRHVYREAFSGFDVDAVAKYTEKQMASLSAEFGLDLGTIRGAVNNACRITEVLSPSCDQINHDLSETSHLKQEHISSYFHRRVMCSNLNFSIDSSDRAHSPQLIFCISFLVFNFRLMNRPDRTVPELDNRNFTKKIKQGQ